MMRACDVITAVTSTVAVIVLTCIIPTGAEQRSTSSRFASVRAAAATSTRSPTGTGPSDVGQSQLQIPATVDRCYLRSICGSTLDGTRQQVAEIPVAARNCFCDELCSVYDDCCQDFDGSGGGRLDATSSTTGGIIAATIATMLPRGVVTCQRLADTETGGLGGGGSGGPEVYVVSRCARDYADVDVRRRCEEVSQSAADRFQRLPVVGAAPTRALYRNVYCAVCAGETRPTFWRALLRCGTAPSPLLMPTAGAVNRTAPTVAAGRVDIQAFVRSAGCPAVFVPPREGAVAPRQCKSNIARCDRNWPDRTSARRCRERVDYVYAGQRAFRNRDCAVCNYVNETYLRCEDTRPTAADDGSGIGGATERVVLEETLPYVVTLDFNRGRSTVASKPAGGGARRAGHVAETVVDFPVCHGDGRIYDPFSDQCRQIFCRRGHRLTGGHCVRQTDPTQEEATKVAKPEIDLIAEAPSSFGIYSLTEYPEVSQAIEDDDGDGDDDDEDDVEEDVVDIVVDEREMITALQPTVGVSSSLFDASKAPNCPLLQVNANDYFRFANGTILVISSKRQFSADQYFYEKDRLFVCTIPWSDSVTQQSETLVGGTLSPRYNFTMFHFDATQRLTSFVGAVVCLVPLSVYLFVVALFSALRSDTFGRSVLCLASSLFVAQLLYLVVLLATEEFPGPLACFYVSAAMQFFFLSAVFWLNVLSIDVFRRLRVKSPSRNNHNNHHQTSSTTAVEERRSRFAMYSVYAWVTPAVVVVGSVTVSVLRIDGWYQPEVVVGRVLTTTTETSGGSDMACWRMGLSELLLYSLSIGLVLTVNIFMYAVGACRLCCRPSTFAAPSARNTVHVTPTPPEAKAKRRLLLCVQLSVLTGATWTLAFSAAVTSSQLLWYLFIGFDALQGIFLCAVVVCTPKVWRLFRNKGRIHRLAGEPGSGHASVKRSNGKSSSSRSKRGKIPHIVDGRNKVVMLETTI